LHTLEVKERARDTGRVTNAVALVAVMLLPTAAAGAAIGTVRLVRWLRRRRDAAVVPAVHSIERLADDARRLRSQLTYVEAGEPRPGRGLRVRALRAAYLEVLTDACQALEVQPPLAAGVQPADTADIYRVEAQLRVRGLDVRETASH
jgi:hypothetical protein